MSELCTSLAVAEIKCDRTLQTWLEQQAEIYSLKYLLAHAEDGVIWGRFDDNKLIIARSVFPQFPALRLLTLQQCRAFGESGEILLWRTHKSWRSRLVQERDSTELIKDYYVLWGTQKEDEKDGFTLLCDGKQGLKHAIPLTGIAFDNNKLDRPLRLAVHHFIEYDEAGVARISISRLKGLEIMN